METMLLKSVAIVYGWSIFFPNPMPIAPIIPMSSIEPTSKNATTSCNFAKISTPNKFAIIRRVVTISTYPKLGICRNENVSDIAYEKIEASTPQDNTLHRMYPPTIEIIVGNGPIQASVYCASPPVVFGINAFNSEREATVVIFNMQAITIAKMKVTPIVPAPCPKETRQLVAIINPTEMETTLPSPNFFSCCAAIWNQPPFF